MLLAWHSYGAWIHIDCQLSLSTTVPLGPVSFSPMQCLTLSAVAGFQRSEMAEVAAAAPEVLALAPSSVTMLWEGVSLCCASMDVMPGAVTCVFAEDGWLS